MIHYPDIELAAARRGKEWKIMILNGKQQKPPVHRASILALVLAVCAAAPQASFAQALGYARTASNDGTQLDAANSFNPLGGTINLIRNGVGNYNIQFVGQFPSQIEMATAIGPEAEYCKIGDAGGTANTYDARIRCFNGAGNAVDTRYAFTMLRPNNPQGIAFAWVAGGTVQPAYSWNPAGAITATTIATGHYQVDFAGIANNGDHVQVSAYGNDNTYCYAFRWGPTSRVQVKCVTPTNTPVNSDFNVSYVKGPGQPRLGFMNTFGSDPTATSFTPAVEYSYNSAGGAVTVTRSATGIYAVKFAGINPSQAAGSKGPAALVVGYGSAADPLRCSTDSINPSGLDLTVNIACFGSGGAAKNGDFNVELIVPAQGVPPVTTFNSSPAGLKVTVDAVEYTTPKTFNFTPGTQHTLNVSSPQTLGGITTTQYAFSSWGAGGCVNTASCTITAGASDTTIAGNFTTQHRITVNLNGGGTVSIQNPPTSHPFYDAGSQVTLTAVPNAGSQFVNWTGLASGATSTNPLSLTMSAATSLTANFSTACTYQVTNTTMTPSPGGATGSSTVTAPAGCAWTAVSNAPWVTITSGANGSGNGTVNYQVAANPNSAARSGTATVAGTTVNFNQSGTACTYTLSVLSASVAGAGGAGSANVLTASDCSWSATSSDSWLSVSGGTVGNGTVQFTAQANPNAVPRTGTILVAGQQFTVNQAAGSPNCTFTLSSSSGSISSNGGVLNVTLTTGATCAWSVFSPDSFVQITSALNGTGPATITLNIASNPSATARNSTITIAGQTFSLSQNGTQGGTTSSPLRFVALDPCRVMETRPEYNFQGRTGAFGPPYMRANETRTLAPPASNVCQVPLTAKAYLVNVTLIPRGGVDFVTLYPTGEGRPQFYSVRSPDGQIVANSAIVKAGTNGGVDVFASNDTDMIIDIAGYFTDNANVSNLVFYPLVPCRVVDTRSEYRSVSGAYGPPTMNQRETRRVRFPGTPFCQIPQGAAAYSMTITAVPPGPLQFLTAWPSGGAQPNVSSINSPAGRVLANSVILPASSDGSIDVFTFDRTDFLIDINGYFAPDDGVNGLFYFPVTQCRAADSTSATLGGLFGQPIYESQVARTLNIPTSPGCSSIPANSKAYVVNVTAQPNGLGLPFITAYPTGQNRPNASILNAFQGQIVTNSAIVPAGTNGSIDVFAFGNRTNVIVEISGYFGR